MDFCRTPDPDNAVVIKTPRGEISTNICRGQQKRTASVSVTSKSVGTSQAEMLWLQQTEPGTEPSAARCRVLEQLRVKVEDMIACCLLF